MIRGHLKIAYDGTELAAITDATISGNLNVVGGAVVNGWGTSGAMLLNWTVSGSILQKVVSSERDSTQKTLETEMLLKSTRFELTLTTPYDAVYTGDAYVTEWSVEASVGSAMSGSFSFTGAGPLTLTE